MEMGVGLCDVPEEIAKAEFPGIRLLTVPHRISFSPESTLECEWLPCGPANLMQGAWGGFSAAAYFFGRDLHRELGVPIGLIHASWGGTVCEAWTSREALIPLGDYQSGIDRVEEVVASPAADQLNAVMDQWYQDKDPGTAKKWFEPGTDVSTWKEATLPAAWGACGLPGYEGIVWARRSFEAPAAWEGRGLVLGLGAISDVDTTWINGTLVGRTDYFDQARIYQVPPGVVKTGENVIAMRISNAGGGGFSGTPDQMKLHPAGEETSVVSLAGKWHVQDTATRAGTGAPVAGNPNVPTVLYNGMIAPLTPFAIKGAIWYQGEANTGQAARISQLASCHDPRLALAFRRRGLRIPHRFPGQLSGRVRRAAGQRLGGVARGAGDDGQGSCPTAVWRSPSTSAKRAISIRRTRLRSVVASRSTHSRSLMTRRSNGPDRGIARWKPPTMASG